MHRTALACVCLIAALAAGPAVAGEKPADVESLRKRFDGAVKSRGTDLASLARLCDREVLPGWAALFRTRAFVLRPDDKRLRKELGYVREGKAWVWPDEARAAVRNLDPSKLVEPASLRKARLAKQKNGARRFVAIANAARPPADAPQGARYELAALHRLAWEQVLEIDPRHEQACRELGYVAYDGRLVRPKAKPFLEARARRENEAREILATHAVVEGQQPAERLARADGGGVRVDGSLSIPDLKLIARGMIHAHRGFAQALRPEDPDGVDKGLTFLIVGRDRPEYLATLSYYGKLSDAEAVAIADEWGAWWVKSRTLVTLMPKAEWAVEQATAYMCRGGARRLRTSLLDAVPRTLQRDEPWLVDAIAMDVTMRLTGIYSPAISSGRKYKGRYPSGPIAWLPRARWLVESDDDTPMREIVERDIDSQRIHETAKAYAFLQYLFERNSLEAAAFAENALVRGGAAAAEEVYSESLDGLDAAYREWVLMTVEPAGH